MGTRNRSLFYDEDDVMIGMYIIRHDIRYIPNVRSTAASVSSPKDDDPFCHHIL